MKKLVLVIAGLVLPLLASAQSWQYTGDLNTSRWNSDMVALDNGTALSVGGFHEESGVLSSCEIYDPATASWSYTGSLNVGRSHPTLVKLANGHVLSMGGQTSFFATTTDAIEDYDPSIGSWSVVGHLTTGRIVPTATLLPNGKILVAGGLDSLSTTLSSCELFDPSTNTVSATGSMSQDRYCAQATLLGNGTVMVAGGRNGGSNSSYLTECEIYDPSTGTWSVTGSMAQGRIIGILTTFSDNTTLAAAGRNTQTTSATGSEVYDISTGTWSNTAAIKEPVCWAGNVLFPDNRFMSTGGIVNGGDWGNEWGLADMSTATCEWYDNSLQRWYYAPTLNLSRCKHDACYIHQTVNSELPEDFLLVAGGKPGILSPDSTHVNYSFTNTAEILDVGVPALKMYMKMKINSGVRSEGFDPNLHIIYGSDNTIKAQFLAAGDGSDELDIMSIEGVVVKHLQNITSVKGETVITLPTQGLAGGAYFIRLSSGAATHMSKFMVY